MAIQAYQPTLKSLHHQTGRLLVLGNRLLVAVILLGSLFCALSLTALYLIKCPEQLLHTQAFMMNYTEFKAEPTTQFLDSPMTKHESDATDPNWDGMLAGAGMGATLGQSIPMIGSIGGPVLGAMIGYQLDSRI